MLICEFGRYIINAHPLEKYPQVTKIHKSLSALLLLLPDDVSDNDPESADESATASLPETL